MFRESMATGPHALWASRRPPAPRALGGGRGGGGRLDAEPLLDAFLSRDCGWQGSNPLSRVCKGRLGAQPELCHC